MPFYWVYDLTSFRLSRVFKETVLTHSHNRESLANTLPKCKQVSTVSTAKRLQLLLKPNQTYIPFFINFSKQMNPSHFTHLVRCISRYKK